MSGRDIARRNAILSPDLIRLIKTGMCDQMDTSFLQDELRQIENEVVASERRLAELEALVAEKKRQRLDTEDEETELQGMRESQRLRQQDRQRILSLMQP